MRICRVDANQASITKELRKRGCSVTPTHMVSNGFPDLVVGYKGLNFVFELKDGTQVASKKQLTEDEKKWHKEWQGTAHIIYSIDDALDVLGIT